MQKIKGFTFLEIVISVVILSIVTVSMMLIFATSVTNITNTGRSTQSQKISFGDINKALSLKDTNYTGSFDNVSYEDTSVDFFGQSIPTTLIKSVESVNDTMYAFGYIFTNSGYVKNYDAFCDVNNDMLFNIDDGDIPILIDELTSGTFEVVWGDLIIPASAGDYLFDTDNDVNWVVRNGEIIFLGKNEMKVDKSFTLTARDIILSDVIITAQDDINLNAIRNIKIVRSNITSNNNITLKSYNAYLSSDDAFKTNNFNVKSGKNITFDINPSGYITLDKYGSSPQTFFYFNGIADYALNKNDTKFDTLVGRTPTIDSGNTKMFK